MEVLYKLRGEFQDLVVAQSKKFHQVTHSALNKVLCNYGSHAKVRNRFVFVCKVLVWKHDDVCAYTLVGHVPYFNTLLYSISISLVCRDWFTSPVPHTHTHTHTHTSEAADKISEDNRSTIVIGHCVYYRHIQRKNRNYRDSAINNIGIC